MMSNQSTFQEIRSYVESSPDSIVACDSSARIVLANRPAESLFCYGADELTGQALQEILPRFDLPSQETRSRADGASAWPPPSGLHLELVGKQRAGIAFPVNASVTAVRSGGSVLVVIILQDLREERRTERERAELLESERSARSDLERANRLKDEFLAVLSHELRTPLNAMLGWVQILRQPNLESGIIDRAANTIERNIRLQSRLIEDLLDMSAISSGKLSLNVCRTGIVPIVQAALDLIAPVAMAKGVALKSEWDARLEWIVADPGRLEQVVWNLLSNAVKFTPAGGEVFVRATQEGSFVQIEVRDPGQGIDPTFLPYVFDRFRQADSSLSRGHGGLGLGLSIVRSLVEMHHGSVRAESAGQGHGSTFIVRLPLAGPAQDGSIGEVLSANRSAPPSSPTVTKPKGLRGIRVLVVDDERDAREFVQRVLEEFGAEVVSCSSAAEALDAIAQCHPNVMLCDIGMPGEDGYQLIQKVKVLATHEGIEMAAVALTAYSREEDRRRSLELGFRLHLAKPVEPMRIVEVVAALANRP